MGGKLLLRTFERKRSPLASDVEGVAADFTLPFLAHKRGAKKRASPMSSRW